MTSNEHAKMPSVAVPVFDEQYEAMEPIIQKLDDYAKAGHPGMLLAQIFDGEMRVFVINEEQAVAFAKMIGVGIRDPRDVKEGTA